MSAVFAAKCGLFKVYLKSGLQSTDHITFSLERKREE